MRGKIYKRIVEEHSLYKMWSDALDIKRGVDRDRGVQTSYTDHTRKQKNREDHAEASEKV